MNYSEIMPLEIIPSRVKVKYVLNDVDYIKDQLMLITNIDLI